MALIAFDADGVLFNFTGGLCSALRAHGFEYTPDDVRHWDLGRSFSREAVTAAREIMSSPGFCAGLEWYEGAANLVRYLRAQGHDVVCLTSPQPSPSPWKNEREAALSEVFSAKDVIFCSGGRKKHFAADVLVEDHPGNAREWLEANPRGVAVLVDRPWNRPGAAEFWPHVRMIRATSLSRVATLVQGGY